MKDRLTMSAAAPESPARRLLRIDVDTRILVITLFLIGVGVSFVLSSSSYFAGGKFDDHFALMRRHSVRCAIAVMVMFLAAHVDFRVYRRAAPMLLLVGLVLMAGVLAFGVKIRDTERWLILPIVNTTLQPSEIARTALVFFLAYWITRAGREFRRFRTGFLPAAAATAIVAGLIAATPNYGTAAATVAIALIVLFVGGARLLHMAAFVGAGVALAAARVASEPYVYTRLQSFLSRGDSIREANWQVHQSLIALGSGGLFGVGFGDSEQKLNWLPDSFTDFIFAILGEEGGLALTLIVSGAFLLLSLRGLKVAHGCGDRFGELVGVGLAASIFVYAVLNMYVATGLAPVTGLPLPFLSYGGSALVMNAFAVGVLLNISKRRSRQERQVRTRWSPCTR